MVGYFFNNLGVPGPIRGFFNHGATNWIPLDCPLGSKTKPSGISGSNIIGTYLDLDGVTTRGFLYDADATNWTSIDSLLGDVSVETIPTGVDGNTIVGTYTDTNLLTHSFRLSPLLLGSSAPPIFSPQTITLDTNSLPSMVAYGTLPWSLNSTASSGLPVSYSSSNPKVATISNTNTITLEGVGVTTITLSQSGDGVTYSAAPTLNVKLTVFKGTQTIGFSPQTPLTFVLNQQSTLSATNSSGLPVFFTSNKPYILTVSGTTLIIKGRGTAIITASHKGTATWYPATSVPVSITVQ